MTPPIRTGPVRVRVVIPCLNEQAHIGACLRSLVEADRTGIELEVRVCDGRSDDGTRQVITDMGVIHPWITLVDNPERTTPYALNAGLRPDGYDVGIILGAHSEVDRAFLVENVALLREHPDAGCVGGIIENVYSNAASQRIGAAMGHPFGVGSAHFRTGLKEGEVDTVAFGAYRREVFDRIGYFDERLPRNQDDEFNFRVKRAGFGIVLSSRIRSRYHVRASFGKLFRQYRQYGYWKVFVNRLHGTVTTWRQLVPASFVGYLLLAVTVSLLCPALLLWWWAPLALYLALAFGFALSAGGVIGCAGVMLAFFILHLGYGIGYWQGIWQFLVLRSEPAPPSASLTR